jgi:hypothetical protein
MLAAAAADVAAVGSTVSAAHMAAAAPTVAVLPAAADEVSAGVAQVFSRAAQEFQGLAGQAVAFNQTFVQHLTAGAGSYAAAEAANAASLQPLTASAGSAASAISDLPGQILNTLSSAVGQLLNLLIPILLNALENLLLLLYDFIFVVTAVLKRVIPILGLGM